MDPQMSRRSMLQGGALVAGDEGTDQETLLAQGVHPNGKGHQIAAGEILTLIDVLRARTR